MHPRMSQLDTRCRNPLAQSSARLHSVLLANDRSETFTALSGRVPSDQLTIQARFPSSDRLTALSSNLISFQHLADSPITLAGYFAAFVSKIAENDQHRHRNVLSRAITVLTQRKSSSLVLQKIVTPGVGKIPARCCPTDG